jgi:hypothetical protein
MTSCGWVAGFLVVCQIIASYREGIYRGLGHCSLYLRVGPAGGHVVEMYVMFLLIRFGLVFQTRNFQGSRKMSRWPKRSKSWRRGFKM